MDNSLKLYAQKVAAADSATEFEDIIRPKLNELHFKNTDKITWKSVLNQAAHGRS